MHIIFQKIAFGVMSLFALQVSYCKISRQNINSGGSTEVKKGQFAITQSVGQPNYIGSTSVGKNKIIAQGFQQAQWGILLKSSTKNLEFTVKPNPFVDHIYMSVKGNLSADLNCQLFDVLGRLIKSFNIPKNQIHLPIPLEGLEVGNYLFRINHHEEHYFKILVKI